MQIIRNSTMRTDIIETVLSNRNIRNLELFLNPDNSSDSNPLLVRNSEQGRGLLLEHLARGSKIMILVDSDADGFTSAAILYQYILKLNSAADIEYIVHSGKAHGLTDEVMKYLLEEEPDLFIAPDSTSNDVARIEELDKNGTDVLVLDHHVVTSFTEKGVIVNNQLCEFTNKNLVGAGMVYKFIQGLDEVLGLSYADTFLDLVAVGQIGDSSDISENEVRNLVQKGLKNILNKFLKVAIGQNSGLVQKVVPKDLSFGVIPLINAVTRVGTLEEREILFEALCGIGENRKFIVPKKKKNKTTGKFETLDIEMSIYEYAFDLCTKAKSRQDSVVKKMVSKLEETVVDDSGIIIAFTGNNDNPGVSGLIANKLVSKYDKPALLLNEQEEIFTGSGRGHEKTLTAFREWCEKSELVEFAQGHDNAFGIAIRKENIEKFKEYARKIEKQDIVYEVDIISNKLSKEDCELVDSHNHLWGGAVKEPFIGIVGLTVPKRFISQKGSVLNIYSWGITCIKFNSPENEIDKFIDYPEDNITINMVGFYGINNWGGRRSPQFIIKDYEIVNNNNEEITEDNIVF